MRIHKQENKREFKFSHFERIPVTKGPYGFGYTTPDGFTTKTIRISAGSLLDESLEDVELDLTIRTDGGIDISMASQDCEDWEIDGFNDCMKHFNWEGWEFMDFTDNSPSVKQSDGNYWCPYTYKLVPRKDCDNSEVYDIVTSPKNLQNLQNVENTIKKFI